MRIADLIPVAAVPTTPEAPAYSENDAKRFKQIVDLADQGVSTEYANTPKEQYADIAAVTVDAGAVNMNGTKEPEDLRGNSFKIYPDKVRT